MDHDATDTSTTRTTAGALPERDRFRRLPPPIRLEDTIATTDAEPARDPDGGRDPQREFMLRYAG